jgi:hypothetical protein
MRELMGTFRQLALGTMTLSACATSSEVTPAVIDAARKTMSCEPVEATALRTLRYEVHGCGQTTYWACAEGSYGMCCERVNSRARALRLIFVSRPANVVCEPVGAEVPLLSN